MSLEDFLSDLGQVASDVIPKPFGDINQYQSASLARFDQFLADASESMSQGAAYAADIHTDVAQVAEIARSRLAAVAPELISLFPKNSEIVQALVEFRLAFLRQTGNVGASIDFSLQWLDRPRQLAFATSLATIDDSRFRQTLVDLGHVLEVGQRLLTVMQTVSECLSRCVCQAAPALTALLEEPELVARLIVAAGGLERLASIPSANIVHVGKENGAGRQTSGAKGIMASSRLVTEAPISEQSKILKTLANKAALAARVDAFRTSVEGMDESRLFKEALERRLKKTPLQPRTVKPLPVPVTKDEKTHRAGKRVRKRKEQIRKNVVASRVKFGTLNSCENGV